MGLRVLHIHEPRIGIGLPARTARPWPRPGDGVLASFLDALRRPAERVVITGRLFDRASPPAHLVDRVVRPLADLVRAGVPVAVPAGAPCGLLFLGAGVGLNSESPDGKGPEFFRAGDFRIVTDGRPRRQRVALPGTVEVRIDVTSLTAKGTLARLASRLKRARGARFVRVILTGKTDDPGVRGLGMKELMMHLPPGLDGMIARSFTETDTPPVPEDDDARRAALSASRERLPDLPETTGVYEFLDSKGRVLYVGKAVNLRRRVASHYTAEARDPSPRGPMLIAARDLRWRETVSELEALLLEARLIHETRPVYNRKMRDPEGSRYLRADLAGPTPELSSEPAVREDGATWYGPFPKRWAVERSLRVLQVVHGLKSCSWQFGEAPPTVCTDRDLSVCSAPCEGRVDRKAYADRVALALEQIFGQDVLFGLDGGAPPFGTLNPATAGDLGEEDFRTLSGFSATARRFLANLREANGVIDLPGGRTWLVLGGQFVEEGTEEIRAAEIRAGADRRIADYRRGGVRTWVPRERAEEARILSFWLSYRVPPSDREQTE